MIATCSGVLAGVDPKATAPGRLATLSPCPTGVQLLLPLPLAPEPSANTGKRASAKALTAAPVRSAIEFTFIFCSLTYSIVLNRRAAPLRGVPWRPGPSVSTHGRDFQGVFDSLHSPFRGRRCSCPGALGSKESGGLQESGRRDSNPRPPGPKPGALTKLRYFPRPPSLHTPSPGQWRAVLPRLSSNGGVSWRTSGSLTHSKRRGSR